MSDLASMRESYERAGLSESDLAADWLAQSQAWLDDAIAAELPEPNAMVFASAGADGEPSARTVLLKGLDERGFVFYSNYSSRKGSDVAANPRGAIVFPWHPLQRQLLVRGRVERVSGEESDAYFASRPHGSRVGAAASPQSQVIASRYDLEQRASEVAKRHPAELPRPGGWGGLRVVPEVVEFWQGRPNRLHDRLRYRWNGAAWVIERLAP